ncbi:MAG: hypothetical protein Q7K34_04075 [archaeon]|nr:hypothetical protein [archaeon]
MDLMNFILAIILIVIALQYGQTWIVFALIILSILTFKSFKTSLALVFSALIVYFVFSAADPLENFPLMLLALLVIALILGVGNKPEEQAASPFGAGYGDPFGGGAV